jgi:hypothetical protein
LGQISQSRQGFIPEIIAVKRWARFCSPEGVEQRDYSITSVADK